MNNIFSELSADPAGDNCLSRCLVRSPDLDLVRARDLLNKAVLSEDKAEIRKFASELVNLNIQTPGILTQALTADALWSRQIGARFGTSLPWIAAVSPAELKDVTSFRCVEHTEDDWRAKLSSSIRSKVDTLLADFSNKALGEKVFVDNPKVHLDKIEVQDGVLSFHTEPAMYSHNAAISLEVGNALYELSLDRNLKEELKNIERVERVISVLSALDLKPGTDGIDFSLGKSALPQTLGVSGIVLTSDGYLLQALQGSKNMTSGGDYVPAISGSADPLEGTICAFDPVKDFHRENHEEQGANPVSFYQILGVFQSLHRLGKPDVIVAAVLHETLHEILSKQKVADYSWELAKQIANATFIGDGVTEVRQDLGDSISPCLRVAQRIEQDTSHELSLVSGAFPFRLIQPGVVAVVDQIRGAGNHVNKAALAAFMMSGLGQE